MMTDEDLMMLATIIVRDAEPRGDCPLIDHTHVLRLFEEVMHLRAGILAALAAGPGEPAHRILRDTMATDFDPTKHAPPR